MKILIADDELKLRKVVVMFLKKHGYEISEASTGEQALEIIDAVNPSVVILDLMMPGIGGLETCRRIKATEKYKNTPVILLTANDNDEDKASAKAAGADEYMTKPFSPKELLEKLNEVNNAQN